MKWDGKKMFINNAECNRCMHCIDAMPEALMVGKDQGLSILFGAKAPILEGAQMGCLTIPFMYANAPYDPIKDLVRRCSTGGLRKAKTVSVSAKRSSASA